MTTANQRTPSYFQQRLARIFSSLLETTQFLGKVAWPLIDIAFRIWLAKQLLISGILMAHNWDTSVFLAAHQYPIPWLHPPLEALLGILTELLGGFTLLFGLFTRLGALAVIMLAIATQLYYVTLDVNLFWIVLIANYVLRGPGPLSLDHLFAHGLAFSPIPFSSTFEAFANKTRGFFSAIYLSTIRLWLGITLLVITYLRMLPQHLSHTLCAWLPIHSGVMIFSYSAFVISLLLITGFSTRLVAIYSFFLVLISYHAIATIIDPLYWMMLFAILFIFGSGDLSLDQIIFAILKRRYPQLSGKPAFTLENLPHVVIIGAGFGGIACAKALYHVPVRITLIDRNNYHLFQPLLYQVATGGLSPGDIAHSVRSIFLDQFNVEVLLGEVNAIDKENNTVTTNNFQIKYDYLVIATGSIDSYFGNNSWAAFAPGLKEIEDATCVRSKLVEAFELAELAPNEEMRHRLLNFIIVGGGPTGVELAGAIAELARYGIEKNFHKFDPAAANVILIQALPRILPAFSEVTSRKAQASLEKIGVKVLVNSPVQKIDAEGVIVNGERIYSKSVLWAAGVSASPVAKWLDVEADAAGRVKVTATLNVPGYSSIFVIGDAALANSWNGKPVPGIAPAAKQEGKYVANKITQIIFKKDKANEFKYIHQGSLATIGRKSAVVEFDFIKLSGAFAWWLWGVVHISFLVGARNRLNVLLNWAWSYFTFRASNLLITKSTDERDRKKEE